MTEEPAAREPLIGLLVGGSTGVHFDRIWNQAADLDVDIEYHWPGDTVSVPDRLPQGLDIVILLVTHMGHKHSMGAKRLAKEADVPIARVPSGGFSTVLKQELDKLGLSEHFGAKPVEVRRDRTWYEWNGKTWVLRQQAPLPPPPPPLSEPVAGVGVLGLLFALVAKFR